MESMRRTFRRSSDILSTAPKHWIALLADSCRYSCWYKAEEAMNRHSVGAPLFSLQFRNSSKSKDVLIFCDFLLRNTAFTPETNRSPFRPVIFLIVFGWNCQTQSTPGSLVHDKKRRDRTGSDRTQQDQTAQTQIQTQIQSHRTAQKFSSVHPVRYRPRPLVDRCYPWPTEWCFVSFLYRHVDPIRCGLP